MQNTGPARLLPFAIAEHPGTDLALLRFLTSGLRAAEDPMDSVYGTGQGTAG